jgi:acetyl-CoA synthetase
MSSYRPPIPPKLPSIWPLVTFLHVLRKSRSLELSNSHIESCNSCQLSQSLNIPVSKTSDCGWITGHTYVVYGPLLNGATTFLFESTPVYPDEGRYWDMIQRHKISQFYTAPTAIRLLMRYGDAAPKKYDLSSLKVLGSVGEPINPEAWRWYYEVVGDSKCTVVDTYWQTETGGHIVTNIPGVTPMVPGSCTRPFYGVETAILDAQTGRELTQDDDNGALEGVLAIKQPWRKYQDYADDGLSNRKF